MAEDSIERLAAGYLRFAAEEAHGRCALYEDLAREIARDLAVLTILESLPREKRQTNLLFAAVKYLYGAPQSWEQLRALISNHFAEISAVILRESTQTNEPARCATILPLMGQLPQPLALLELGPSAGLCLLPDYYGYDYAGYRVLPVRETEATPPTFSCTANRDTPLPVTGLQVAWRAGLDLKPIDVHDNDRIAWLEALVWPDEGDRVDQLRRSVAIARLCSPPIRRGDLRSDLPALAVQAPKDATLVVFHSAVLGYLARGDRAAFVETMHTLDATWISNEAPEVFPEIALAAGLNPPWPPGCFLLSMNERPIAWTDPHGASVEWIVDA